MKKNITELLYLSFDGQLTEDEQRRLQDALEQSAQLQQEKERIAALRGSIAAGTPKSFRPFFAERVMHRIAALGETRNGTQKFFESLQFAFRRVALVGATAILLLLVFNVVKTGNISVAGALGIPQETLVEVLESPFDATVEDLL